MRSILVRCCWCCLDEAISNLEKLGFVHDRGYSSVRYTSNSVIIRGTIEDAKIPDLERSPYALDVWFDGAVGVHDHKI